VSFLELKRYDNIEKFRAEVLPVLLEDEVANNLFIGLIARESTRQTSRWQFVTVGSASDGICLAALYIEPFDLLLYESGGAVSRSALECISQEFKRIGCTPQGVMAKKQTAERFSEVFTGSAANNPHMRITAMRLDVLSDYTKASGACRTLENRDLFFAPYWERAFSEDCRTKAFSISENLNRLMTRLGKGTHFIWEDGVPVSQAVHGRDTPNGAVINGVYTPPHYRGRGYATSVVAELSASLLSRGKGFCCLFADASNITARNVYLKLGYYDVGELEVIKFV